MRRYDAENSARGRSGGFPTVGKIYQYVKRRLTEVSPWNSRGRKGGGDHGHCCAREVWGRDRHHEASHGKGHECGHPAPRGSQLRTRRRPMTLMGVHRPRGRMMTLLVALVYYCGTAFPTAVAAATRVDQGCALEGPHHISWGKGVNLLWDKQRVQRAMAETMIENGGDGEEEVQAPDEGKHATLSVITANIRSLDSRAEEVLAWDADLLLLQETKLTAHDIKDAHGVAKKEGWTMLHGKPCMTGGGGGGGRKKRARTSAATRATSGGVAAFVRRPRRPIAHTLTKDQTDLLETGRWQKVKIPLAHGARCLTAATVYGISGASSDARKKRANEDILAAAIGDLLDAGDDPYLLCGDVNLDPERSPSIAEAVDAGLLVDIGHLWAAERTVDEEGNVTKCPDPTFSAKGPIPGMRGDGVSRLDVILANPVAAAAVIGFTPRWDLVQVDHVPLQVDMRIRDLAAYEVVHKAPGKVNTDKAPPEWHRR